MSEEGSAEMNQDDPLLRMEHISKAFPGVVALVNAHLSVNRGEVHALVGQNGAGKSTLIKILTGAHRRDGGNIIFDGRAIDFQTPQQAQNNGISTIYQEINLVPFRSVAENVFMTREPRRWGFIDWHKMRAETAALLKRLSVSIDVTQPLMNYNIAIQQMVSIARAIAGCILAIGHSRSFPADSCTLAESPGPREESALRARAVWSLRKQTI